MTLIPTLARGALLASCLAFGLAAPAAHAGFTISASYNLGTSSSVGATAASTTACGDISGADALLFTGSGGNNIGLHTYGCQYNNGSGGSFFDFGSRSSGENTFFANGSMSLVTQLSGTSFGFNVNPGQIGAFGSTAFGAGEFQKSSLSIRLIVDGTTVIDDVWLAMVGPGGATTTSETHNGTQSLSSTLTTGAGYASYQMSGGFVLVDGLAAGTHDIDYLITSEAAGKVISTSVCRAPYVSQVGIEANVAFIGDGIEGPLPPQDADFAAYCGAGAQSGDPFPDLARAIPEPASGALLAMAFVGLAAFSRRRSQFTD